LVVVEEVAPVEAPAPPQPPTVVVWPVLLRAVPPPVVIYQPVPAAPPTRVIIVTRGYGYGGYGYPAYRPVRPVVVPQRTAPVVRSTPQKRSEWGMNLRVEGLALGRGKAENAGMGGLGLSLRYRPVPAFAFDMGVDVLAGVDYNGFHRTETPLSLSGMIFVNPKSRMQFYFMGGVNYSHAKVRSDVASPLLVDNGEDFSARYSYLGAQGGAGLEFRISKHLGLNVDGLGFVRRRVDDGPTPEFRDPKTGKDTKSSGGGIFRGGISFWW
jgi:opacity protein-like surface antigen